MRVYRWHKFTDSMYKQLIELNSLDDSGEFSPAMHDMFLHVVEWFIWNWDETCAMAKDGKLAILGDADIKKHQKNLDDSRESITALRTGCAKGNGPTVFLCKGERVAPGFTQKFFENRGMVGGTCVLMTPSAFMTIEVWRKIVEIIPDALREYIPILAKFPTLWIYTSVDGFGVHTLDARSNQKLREKRMMMGKEEGDSSDTNQAYDRDAALSDKAGLREYLGFLRSATSVSRGVVDQWGLVHVMVQSILGCTEEIWETSFIKTNLHIKARVSFEEWLKRIEAHLQAGATFKFETLKEKFWLLSPLWHGMSPDERRATIKVIDEHHASFTVECVQDLKSKCHIAPADMQKIRVAYDVSKEDPSSIDITNATRQTSVAEAETNGANQKQATDLVLKGLVTFQRVPSHLVGKGKGEELLKHQLTFLKRTCNTDVLEPSAYLDIEISKDQRDILNPTASDMTIREIMKDAGGRGATKKFAKRKLDSVGYVQSQCYAITDPKRIARQVSALKLAESVAEISCRNLAQAALKRAQEDDDLIPIAAHSIGKLVKAKMDWSKLTIREIRSTCLVYLKTNMKKQTKALLVIEAAKLYHAAQTNMKSQFNIDADVVESDDEGAAATNEDEDSSDDQESKGNDDSSDDEASTEGDDFSELTFAVDDNVRVWWLNEDPPAWFDGVVEKVCTIMLKINYPETGDWQHHDPTKWKIEKR